MNTAEWIIVAILSFTLFVFLILAIILTIKLIKITKEAQKIVLRGQDIANNANDVVTNVKGMTSVGGIVQTFANKCTNPEPKTKKSTTAKK